MTDKATQVSIWEAIDEAEGVSMRTAGEIADVLRALTPEQPTAMFRPREWTDLMLARRRVVADTGRFFVTRRLDDRIECTLTYRNMNAPDVKPGDVLWDGRTITQVHRRDGKVRYVTEPDTVGDWISSNSVVRLLARKKVAR